MPLQIYYSPSWVPLEEIFKYEFFFSIIFHTDHFKYRPLNRAVDMTECSPVFSQFSDIKRSKAFYCEFTTFEFNIRNL